MPILTVDEIAKVLGGELLRGEGARQLSAVRPLDDANSKSLSFVSKQKYLSHLSTSKAAAVLITADMFEKAEPSIANGICVITVKNPYLAFARAAQIFTPQEESTEGVHPSAVIEASAKVHSSAHVGPFVFIGENAVIDENVTLHPGVHVEAGAKIGAGSILYDHVVIRHDCQLGKRCIIHPGVVIGSDGFGFAQDPHGSPSNLEALEHVKIPQIGDVVIEDDVEIGSNSCVDRGALGTTRIQSGTKIDNLVQIGHNVEIGKNCIIVAQSGIAGSSKLKTAVTLAAQAGIAGHLEIGSGALVFGQAGVAKDVADGEQVMGTPAIAARSFLRNSVHFAQLTQLSARIKKLEKKYESEE